jgi:hypothetical protein
MGDYIPGAPVNDAARQRNGSLPGMGGIFNLVNLHVYHYAGNNPVKYTDPDGKKIVVGISTAKSGSDPFGQHAFVMYIDNYNPEKSVMLDAHGQFGNGRASDVVDGAQTEISISKYLQSFNNPEILTVFEINLSESDEKKIKDLILEHEGRGVLPDCASKASALLKNSELFPEVSDRVTPKGLLKDMQKYAENHPDVIVERYDFQTKAKIDDVE